MTVNEINALIDVATLVTNEAGDNVGVFIPIDTWRKVTTPVIVRTGDLG